MIFSDAVKDKLFHIHLILKYYFYIILFMEQSLIIFVDVIIPIIGSVFFVKYSPKQYLLFGSFLNAN